MGYGLRVLAKQGYVQLQQQFDLGLAIHICFEEVRPDNPHLISTCPCYHRLIEFFS